MDGEFTPWPSLHSFGGIKRSFSSQTLNTRVRDVFGSLATAFVLYAMQAYWLLRSSPELVSNGRRRSRATASSLYSRFTFAKQCYCSAMNQQPQWAGINLLPFPHA